MKLIYNGAEFQLETHYRPEDGRVCVEIIARQLSFGAVDEDYGGVGRDFNSAFMDLMENIQVHYTP